MDGIECVGGTVRKQQRNAAAAGCLAVRGMARTAATGGERKGNGCNQQIMNDTGRVKHVDTSRQRPKLETVSVVFPDTAI